MPKIEHIIGQGPELSESQRRVLGLLEKHPDHLFRMNSDDLMEIKAWLTSPDQNVPPIVYIDATTYTIGTIKWAISTLHARGKIGSIELHRRW